MQQEVSAVAVGDGQSVAIECRNQELDYSNFQKGLELGAGAQLQFTNCILRNFDFSEGLAPEGATLRVQDSKIGFGATCVVRFFEILSSEVPM